MKKLIALALMLCVGAAWGQETNTFGTLNDGNGGFEYFGALNVTNTYLTTNATAVTFRNQAEGAPNGGFIKELTIDRTPDNGVFYTVSANVTYQDGYADDNNRTGIILFTDTNSVTNRNDAGQIGVIWNTDDSSSAGPPGNNADDKLLIAPGYDGAGAFATSLRNQTIPYAQTILQGGNVEYSATFWFSGTDIHINASMTDAGGETTMSTAVVPEASYTNNYFGFTHVFRARNYSTNYVAGSDTNGTGRANPYVVDYNSFTLIAQTDTTAPSLPSSLAATSAVFSVELDWNDSTDDLSGVASYNVYSSTTSGVYGAAVTNVTESTAVVTGLADGTEYFFKVSAVDGAGNESALSTEEASAIPLGDIVPPSVPANLAAAPFVGRVFLNWNASTDDIAGVASYNVFRSTTSGSGFAQVGSSTTTNYTDAGLVSGTEYFYKVSAVDGAANESAQSAEASATPVGTVTVNTFGSANDGYAGFSNAAPSGTEVWSLATDSVNYQFEGVEAHTTSLLKEYSLDNTFGAIATFEGVVELTDGYGDDNNRMGLLLFNQTASQTGDGGGGLYLRLNTDNNKEISIRDGINGTDLASKATGVGAGDDWIGKTLTYQADLVFTNSNGTNLTDVTFTLSDGVGNSWSCSTQVETGNYSGKYFGFAPKWRNRGSSSSNRNVPPEFNYQTWTVGTKAGSGVSPYDDYQTWLDDNGLPTGTAVDADSDGDGVKDLFEFATGGLPNDDTSTGTAPVLTEVNGSFIYTYAKNAETTIIDYTVETTTNLLNSGSWTNSGTALLGDDGGTPITLVSNSVSTVTDEKFIRVKVQRNDK